MVHFIVQSHLSWTSEKMEPSAKRARVASSDIDEIIMDRKDLVVMLSDKDTIHLRELLLYSYNLSFSRHRDNYYDKLALLDCALEIVISGVDNEKNAMEMCSKIQRHISNDEIREGWRVSFGAKGKSHRFFYLNDRMKRRRSISFRCVPEPQG